MGRDFANVFEVARDGSLWFNTHTAAVSESSAPECDGIINFDGDTVRHFLRDLCVYAMDIAPDGTVWLQASDSWEPEQPEPAPVHAYAITPAAVAAAG